MKRSNMTSLAPIGHMLNGTLSMAIYGASSNQLASEAATIEVSSEEVMGGQPYE